MSADAQAERERRVLLFVATRRDAEVSARLLATAGIPSHACASVDELILEIQAGTAAILATDELLEASVAQKLVEQLDRQEEWSNLPIVLLLDSGRRSEPTAEALRHITNVVTLERPTGMVPVLSAVRAAIRSRCRQYETRAHIEAIQAAEAKARAANQAKNDFLAALSHELRTPLTPVLLLASEAATNPDLPADVREAFEIIVKNIGLEARLIDDLLDLTRITHGKLRLELEPVDVVRILREAIATVRPESEQKAQRLLEVLPEKPVTVIGDAIRLQQVFWNVLRNAVKFTPAKGSVAIAAAVRRDRIVITVADSGIGMEPAELARAFEAFVQGEHAKQDGPHRFGGLGLGLAISRPLLELHAGDITATSAGRGHGATFTITLPVAHEATSEERPAARPASRPTRPLRILLVEDHEESREALRRMLLARGHDVTAAASVAAARASSRSGAFDLVLTDIGLPDGSGYELLRELALPGEWLGVALTGYGMEDDVARSREAGFFAHVTKPLSAAALDGLLDSVAAKFGAGA
ncbi:MAG TPA: ATP-binding protein [Lacunisphaera sp.]|nr:ATP-binding protein [Lacunisphaera sp.]